MRGFVSMYSPGTPPDRSLTIEATYTPEALAREEARTAAFLASIERGDVYLPRPFLADWPFDLERWPPQAAELAGPITGARAELLILDDARPYVAPCVMGWEGPETEPQPCADDCPGCATVEQLRERVRLDLGLLEVESFVVPEGGGYPGMCQNPECDNYDLLDEDGACSLCECLDGEERGDD